jgi:hypothetical protein
MNAKRFILTGIVASILFLLLDAVFGVVGGIVGEQVFGIPSSAPDESKMGLGLLFELINGFMLAGIYALIHTSLPGDGWRKGLSYGLIVWGLRVLMWAFSTYMMTDMAPILISITVFTGLLEILVICVAIAALYPGNAAK